MPSCFAIDPKMSQSIMDRELVAASIAKPTADQVKTDSPPQCPPTCGHFIQEKDGHAKQCNHFLVPFRKIKFRFVVGTQIEEAMQSGRSNLNARKGHIQRNEKQRWGSSLCVFYLNICSRDASRCSGLALHAVYDRPKEDGREQEAFT